MLGNTPSITQRRSSWYQAPFLHELEASKFDPVLFLQSLREVQITSNTGMTERRAVLNKLSNQQLVDIHNTLVDQCMVKGINNEQYLFDAIDRTIGERKELSTTRNCQGIVIPRTQAYVHNTLSGGSQSINPNQKLYHLSLTQ